MHRNAVGATAIAVAAGLASAQVVPPTAVPGKEYIAERNINAAGAPAPGQVLQWDGLGGVADGVLFPGFELDAIANHGDFLVPELIADQACLVTSFRKFDAIGPVDVNGPTGARAGLWYHESTPFGSGSGVWAYTLPEIDAHNNPRNVFGVEVWGPSNDTDTFSAAGDLGGVAAWSAIGGVHPYLSTVDVATAIHAPPGLNIDVDGLMVNDTGVPGQFDPGDTIIFSIAPNGAFDGGEIWWMTMTPAGAIVSDFLHQGGVVWDTAHSVSATFGIDTENIDAIEAIVPTPGTVGLFGLAALGTIRRRRA